MYWTLEVMKTMMMMEKTKSSERHYMEGTLSLPQEIGIRGQMMEMMMH